MMMSPNWVGVLALYIPPNESVRMRIPFSKWIIAESHTTVRLLGYTSGIQCAFIHLQQPTQR